METPRLRSPLARAVVPVLGGIVFFTLFFAGLWVVAGSINDRADPTDAVANKVFEVGKVEPLAKSVAEDGPLLFPDLKSPDGVRSIVLDHTGDDPATGWRVYYGYPADRDSTCLVTHEQGSREFTDCDGRTLSVDDLQLPEAVRPIVENRKTLYVDLRGVTTPTLP
ncbi:MAG: hypothetical protein F2618_00680 [Actinobacteria bacterium]|nr:hypothetical protein [Actinomycetota bacterium]